MPSIDQATGGHRARRFWASLAVLVAVGGIAASAVIAELDARGSSDRERLTFHADATQVASTLELAIEHEKDLVIDGAAYAAANPDGSQAEFLAWGNAVRALARYPELQGLGFVKLVPAAELSAFAARMVASQPPRTMFRVFPPGRRPFYCLGVVGIGRGNLGSMTGVDYCATNATTLAARDTGRGAYYPIGVGSQSWLGIDTPVYRGAGIPSAVSARRRLFVGWLGEAIDPGVLLRRALQGHRARAVSLSYGNGVAPVTFTSGRVGARPASVKIDLRNGWLVTVTGSLPRGGLLHDTSARAILVGGSTVALLVGLLLYVLATGRGRAIEMVEEKTRLLGHQALHDTLTGLANRALVLDRAEQMLARNRRHPDRLAVALYVDIDGFKKVNDTYGHAAGDHVLATVAGRLVEIMRDQDTVGRLGGDEFVVLFEASAGSDRPNLIAQRLVDALRRPIVLPDGETSITTSASVGIAVGQRDSADELLADADFALYEAKTHGKDRFVLFESRMHVAALDRLGLEADLSQALAGRQFFLVYQPTFDLRSREVLGVEALIRWRHPTRGVVFPDDFIPVAEETGMIVPIGRWVLQEACRQLALWQKAGHEIGVAVNVSAYQLDRDGLAGDVAQAIADAGVDPALLTLEITETALMHNVHAAARRLEELKQIGVRLAIDDFGTGYSSLAYLRQFPVDALKIDRSFITNLATSTEAAAIIETLVQLGKTLRIDTLAEGIEDSDQLRHLQRVHCDQGQGFLFARPLGVDAIQELLAVTAPRAA